MLVIMQRILGVAKSFCDTICPMTSKTGFRQHAFWDSVSVTSDNMEDVSYCQDNSGARFQLFLKFAKIQCHSLCVYVDNMICMDLCGTSLSLAKRLAGPKLIEHLQSQRHSGFVWGCRHDVVGSTIDCYDFVGRSTFLLCDRYEPVTEQMCSRVNDVAAMLQYLQKYCNSLCDIFGIHDDQDMAAILHGDSIAETGYESAVVDDYVVIESNEYNTEHDEMPTEASSLFSTPRPMPVEGLNVPIFAIVHCWRHVMAVLRAMCRLIAYRLNLFLRDALALLLSPDLPSPSIANRLQPIHDFLSSYLNALCDWLYGDCFRRVQQFLWLFIIEDFEEEVSKLKKGEYNIEKQAEVLTRALSCLMKFMNNSGKGMAIDQLLTYSEDVSFKLQLYTLTTHMLSVLYENLVLYYSESAEVNSQADLPRGLFHKMKIELQSIRKCFSGRQLVSWLLRNQERGFGAASSTLDNLDPDTGRPFVSRESAQRLAQKLVERGIIVDVELDPSLLGGHCHTSSVLSHGDVPYPSVSIHSHFDSISSDSDDSSTEDVSRTSEKCLADSVSTIVDSEEGSDRRVTGDTVEDNSEINHNDSGFVRSPDGKESTEFPELQNPQKEVVEREPVVARPDERVENKTRSREDVPHSNEENTGDTLQENEAQTSQQMDVVKDGVYDTHEGTEIQSRNTATHDHRTLEDSGVGIEKVAVGTRHSRKYLSTDAEEATKRQTPNNRTPQSSISEGATSVATSQCTCAFVDSTKKFYIFSTEQPDEVIKADRSHTFSDNLQNQLPDGETQRRPKITQELFGMVETCFHKKIKPDFILLILYARRKYDKTAKKIFKNIPENVLNRLYNQVDAPNLTCVGC